MADCCFKSFEIKDFGFVCDIHPYACLGDKCPLLDPAVSKDFDSYMHAYNDFNEHERMRMARWFIGRFLFDKFRKVCDSDSLLSSSADVSDA